VSRRAPSASRKRQRPWLRPPRLGHRQTALQRRWPIRGKSRPLPGPREQRRLQGAKVLWVDDRPNNNRFERQALEALGIDVELSLSTDDALDKLRRRPYDLIISDMGRPGDPRAGYTLLDRLRSGGNLVPYVIYAGSRAPEHVREAREHGAIGSTNRPQELVSMVTAALTMRR
jgi:CheY-like chemotaxis protein